MPSYNTPTTPVVQVAHIETEKLLIKLVHDELARRKANGTFHGKFSALSHYFG
jgi:pyrophosphate--fructose-6-phosphate 1-phosphotransferase